MTHDACTVEEIRACAGDWLFCDGGVIFDRNGVGSLSTIGGPWAWFRVIDGKYAGSASGVLTPADIGLPAVSNNVSELYAMAKALDTAGRDFRGTIVSDSHVTLCRRFRGAKMNGVPDIMAAWARVTLDRAMRAKVRFVHVDGHPTRLQLETGIGKSKSLVSEWNVRCDEECGRIGALFTKNRGAQS